jgi:hypothetical protein
MTRVFTSKVDRWIVVLLVIAIVLSMGAFVFMALMADPLSILFTGGLVAVGAGLPLWIMATTRYTLDGETLRINSGPFRWRVPVKEITSVTPTHNPLSSPALSIDRLSINYGKRRWIMISPVDKDDFITALRKAGAKV